MGFDTHHQNTQSGLSTRRDASYRGNFGSFGRLRCPRFNPQSRYKDSLEFSSSEQIPAGHSNSWLGYGFLSRPFVLVPPRNKFQPAFHSFGSATGSPDLLPPFRRHQARWVPFLHQLGSLPDLSTAGSAMAEERDGSRCIFQHQLGSDWPLQLEVKTMPLQSVRMPVPVSAEYSENLTKFPDDDVEFKLLPGVDLLMWTVWVHDEEKVRRSHVDFGYLLIQSSRRYGRIVLEITVDKIPRWRE